MKKILIILITIPLIFGSCEKEDDSPDLIDKSFCEYPSFNLNSLIVDPIFICTNVI